MKKLLTMFPDKAIIQLLEDDFFSFEQCFSNSKIGIYFYFINHASNSKVTFVIGQPEENSYYIDFLTDCIDEKIVMHCEIKCKSLAETIKNLDRTNIFKVHFSKTFKKDEIPSNEHYYAYPSTKKHLYNKAYVLI